MFGRIRAAASSLDSLDGSPSKILKDDSLSIYESTLMKLKLGAQRDTIARASSDDVDEVMSDDCSVIISPEPNMDPDCTPASDSSSQLTTVSPCDGLMMNMEANSSSITTSPSVSDSISTGNLELRRHSNVSILHFFKFKDPGHATVSSSSCGEATTSTKNGGSGSISSSSSSVESHCTSEMESIQTSRDCDLFTLLE